ncbi:hypothetical protein PV325_006991, partial [Microctonus aethiopoides]
SIFLNDENQPVKVQLSEKLILSDPENNIDGSTQPGVVNSVPASRVTRHSIEKNSKEKNINPAKIGIYAADGRCHHLCSHLVRSLSIFGRRKLVSNALLCQNCCGRHATSSCKSAHRCKECKELHHTLLHPESQSAEPHPSTTQFH